MKGKIVSLFLELKDDVCERFLTPPGCECGLVCLSFVDGKIIPLTFLR